MALLKQVFSTGSNLAITSNYFSSMCMLATVSMADCLTAAARFCSLLSRLCVPFVVSLVRCHIECNHVVTIVISIRACTCSSQTGTIGLTGK